MYNVSWSKAPCYRDYSGSKIGTIGGRAIYELSLIGTEPKKEEIKDITIEHEFYCMSPMGKISRNGEARHYDNDASINSIIKKNDNKYEVCMRFLMHTLTTYAKATTKVTLTVKYKENEEDEQYKERKEMFDLGEMVIFPYDQ